MTALATRTCRSSIKEDDVGSGVGSSDADVVESVRRRSAVTGSDRRVGV